MVTFMQNDEILISAFGCVTPIGNNYSQIANNLRQGISGIKENKKFCCEHYITKHAGIPDEGNNEIRWPAKGKSIIGELFYAGLAAKRLKEHPLFPNNYYPDNRLGCIIGTDEPTIDFQFILNLAKAKNVHKDLLSMMVNTFKISDCINCDPSTTLNVINKEIPFSGYAKCHLGLCSASLQAIGMGMNAIRNGLVDAAIVGGVSGKVNPINLMCLELIGAISLDTRLNPTQRSRPFDKRRSGFVLAEGGVLFLLEKKSSLLKRKEKGLLQLLGYGSSMGAQHIVAPHTESLEMELSMQRAMQYAKVLPEQIDLVNAHGTSTVLNDLHEAKAINTIFGQHVKKLKVTANKSIHGHLIAAAGAMEVLNTLISLNENFIPGTINLEEQDETCNVNVASKTEQQPISIVLKNSFGMGGLAASMVLKKVFN